MAMVSVTNDQGNYYEWQQVCRKSRLKENDRTNVFCYLMSTRLKNSFIFQNYKTQCAKRILRANMLMP